jgi:hypothetical protein
MVSRNRRRAPAQTRPSWFFIFALLVGLILLIWGASAALRRQTTFRTPPAKSAIFSPQRQALSIIERVCRLT